MKIYLCSNESAHNYKSWSNIPYLIKTKLEAEGYCVKNIILYELEPVKSIFNLFIRVKNFLKKDKTTFFYNRTYFHYFFCHIYSFYIKIKAKKEDIVIILGYTHPPIIFKNKTILLGDWPYKYIFQHFLKRTPTYFETCAIAREGKEIERAHGVITLFPDVRDYMLSNFINRNIYFLGNFVNVDFDLDPIQAANKESSNRVLFIGRSQYISGARELVNSISNLRSSGLDISLDVVGITEKEMGLCEGWVTLHGYLDKGVPQQKAKFYELLARARVVANTTSDWNGFQALLEGMYFSNPVLIRSNPNVAKFFANLSEFSYLVDDKQNNLSNVIKEIFENKELYLSKVSSARKESESHTWDSFIKKITQLIHEK